MSEGKYRQAHVVSVMCGREREQMNSAGMDSL